MWNEFLTKPPQGGFVLLPENGWEALVLAVAGSGHGARYPKRGVRKEISVVTTTAGSTTVKKVPFTDQDQGIIDDFLDEYLVAAGFEPRPRGYDWYLRLPNGITSFDELCVVLNAALAEENAGGHPAQVRPVFERVLANLYTY
ncbi:hypothetical protein CXX84_04450 [Arthrobacter sp. AFG7.2]|uniref:DUF5956 family protein n=1 Tax=Arthrobacter sp. AFG7.2 TaxID=1688693 RepID=UPI000C9E00A2|nr:hypothetical protein CXX84_04450 [Arthrobacter sp. AFG7.2]